MKNPYILAIDQGTSGTKAVLFDGQGQIAAKASSPLRSYYPRPGFVEQDPEEIYESVLDAARQCIRQFTAQNGKISDIVACGISNQRETFLLWDNTGRPLCPAVVWQCKRSVDICEHLKGSAVEKEIIAKTGLLADPYFSGTKLIWLYENNPRIRDAVASGNAYFGTVDTWLLFKLTNGTQYCTDYTNASRTLFFNIHTLRWDLDLLKHLSLTGLNLPEARPSAYLYGASDFQGLFQKAVKISAMIGDSHAAAMGEGCFDVGTAKATMGTGCSILLNTGSKPVQSQYGMVTTICWSAQDRVDYALEGVIVTCGAAIKWIRDQLGLFGDSRETEAMARAVPDSNGIAFIPAFSGLGTPYWRMDLKAAIAGLTLGSDKRHVVRAALESIPIQIKDVIDAMQADSGIQLAGLNVDGGITANRFVMQFLADLLNVQVTNIGMEEVSALGAAYLAGLQEGVFSNLAVLAKLNQDKTVFSPVQDRMYASDAYKEYQKYLHILLKA
ncbi:MAG TPA: glycerol kinase GlpK [Anaerohalosphaeraceae bacterium]|nr:glycerol kinase GlpK [Phycisphaerae bacterium]HOL32628.1 glycerol kinase GlpK [Anaerohalosphaeraceae bacterium]HOM75174.1 glycerol kinase GlpK [Anaerohalosphaeraceae bacterium]HPC63556.1 glycerol kinase GlpK [Anaerohalosphaeraceae bacterium]HPO69699.1 glycerol kinase GlpK [Anaerohalosphaeraceae bacterium]